MKLRRRINGDFWTIRIITEKQMNKEYGSKDAAAGLCIPSKKTIFIEEECVNYETVAHEYAHATWSALHLDDTNTIPLMDIEEIFCSLFAAKGENMVKQAKRLTKDLKKLQAKGQDE